MATQAQFEVYKAVYDDEGARLAELRNTVKIYLTICSFFLGGLAFKLNDVFSLSSGPTRFFYAVAVVLFVVAFLLLVRAHGIYTNEVMFDPMESLKDLEENEPTDSDFFDKRISDIAAAVQTNKPANNRRATLIQCASYSMFAGIIVGLFSLAGPAIDSTSSRSAAKEKQACRLENPVRNLSPNGNDPTRKK